MMPDSPRRTARAGLRAVWIAGPALIALAAVALVLLLPRHPSLSSLLGAADRLSRQGDQAGAAALLRQALQLAPQSAEAHFALALATFRLQQSVEALEHYAQGLRSDIALFEQTYLPEFASLAASDPAVRALLKAEILGEAAPAELPASARAAALDLAARLSLRRSQELASQVGEAWRSLPAERSAAAARPHLLPEHRPQDLRAILTEQAVPGLPERYSAAYRKLLLVALQASGARARARELFVAALRELPSFSPSALALARLELSEQHIEKAAGAYRTLIGQPAASDDVARAAAWELARLEERRGEPLSALELLQQLAARSPQFLPARLELLLLRGQLGQADEALLEAYRLADEHPQNASIQTTLGLLLAQVGLYAEAESILERGFTPQADSAQAHFNLAVVEHHLGKHDEAAVELRRALSLEPQHLAARRALAASLLGREQYQAAADQARELAAYQPGQPDGPLLLGIALAWSGQTDAALRALPGLPSSGSGAPPGELAVQYRTALLLACGQAERARDELAQAIQERPTEPSLHAAAAFASLEQGRLQEAQGHYRKSLELGGPAPEAHLYLARIALLAGDREAARRQLLFASASGAPPLAVQAGSLSLGALRALPPLLILREHSANASAPAFSQVYFSLLRSLPSEELLRKVMLLEVYEPLAATALAALQRAGKTGPLLKPSEPVAGDDLALREQLLRAAERFLLEISAAAPARIAATPAWWPLATLRPAYERGP